jgi:hypothetical protein
MLPSSSESKNISQSRNQLEAGTKQNSAWYLLNAGCLIGLCSSETLVDVQPSTLRYTRIPEH